MPRPPTPVVTLADIAAACGVTKATVSMVMSQHPRISQATADRVRAQAQRLGYDPERSTVARRLAAQRHQRRSDTLTVAVAMPGLISQGPFFAEILRGILEGLRHAGRSALILPLDAHGRAATDAVTAPLRRGDVDAIIYMAPTVTVQALLRVPGCADLPRVSLLHHCPGVAHVWADEQQGAHALALHLTNLGHRHFLVSTLDGGSDGRQGARFSGFRAGLSAAGLDPHLAITWMHIPSGWLVPPSPEGEVAVAEPLADGSELLARVAENPAITAYVALNDPDARRACAVLQQAGIAVPGHLSITGFDGTDQQAGPRLTSIAVPFFALGRRAVSRLLEADDHAAEELLPVHLQPGDSTGRARTNTPRKRR